MYTLLLETGSRKGLMAVAFREKIIFKEELPFGIRESAEPDSVLEAAMKQNNLSFKSDGFIFNYNLLASDDLSKSTNITIYYKAHLNFLLHVIYIT